MATHSLQRDTMSPTTFGAALLLATLVVAAIVAVAMARGGDSSPATGSPAELVAEKERALASGPGEPSLFERIGEQAPDIGAASHPLLLIGLAMAAVGAGYLVLIARKSRPESQSTGGTMIRSAATVESILLVVIGPLLALVAYIGIGGLAGD